ncbi:MAG TPA: amidase [Verrucomicrobiae bacterium]
MNRREFLQRASTLSAISTVSLTTGCLAPRSETRLSSRSSSQFDIEEATIRDLQAGLSSGRYTAVDLVRSYQSRIDSIDRRGPQLKSVIEVNPDAVSIAASLDAERMAKGTRGPLHGIPVLIKDNIDTHDRMSTTAGSLALSGSIPLQDATVVQRLRLAGAIILGKTNLSEWANFRGSNSVSGWSARGGQTRNPYFTDRNPSGSSSGSAVATSANLCAASIGTETNGSIVSPSSYCGIVGLKPTVGLVSRTGIIPISAAMDTAGPMTRTVTDAAVLLGVLAGPDPKDEATQRSAGRIHQNYTQFLKADALRGTRIGVLHTMFRLHPKIDTVLAAVLRHLEEDISAEMVNLNLPALPGLSEARYQVMLYEFKAGLNAYFASLGPHSPVKRLEDLIEFNRKEHRRELAIFGQEILLDAVRKGPLTDSVYLEARNKLQEWRDILTRFMDSNRVEALIAPTAGPAPTIDYITGDRGLGGSSTPAATAGFPHITVPCGNVYGLPLGLSFFGRAWSEPTLLSLAYAFEQSCKARIIPKFHSTMEASYYS